ncbi:hypothetical protein CPB85DRAFT_1566646 [Mucidula mucida]|nr:hypothetical protein CPB85DRAFT_1566646 [Mucidula mucida]
MDHSPTANIPGVPKGFAPVTVPTPNSTAAVRCDDSIATIVTRHHPENAEKFLREQILNPTVLYDTFTWAAILQNAFRRGASWLDINDRESLVWMKLLRWLIQPHECLEHTVCDINQSCKDIASLPIYGGELKITIRDYPSYPSTRPVDFESVVTFLMRPSICECLARILYPNLCRDVVYAELPHDIILNLALIHLSSVQSTSRDEGENIMSSATNFARHNVSVDSSTVLNHHKEITKATFRSMIAVVNNEAFFTDMLTTSHKLRILQALFRTLVLDPKLVAPLSDQLPPMAIQATVALIFKDFPKCREAGEIIAEIVKIRWPGIVPGQVPTILGTEVRNELYVRNWLAQVHEEIMVPLVVAPKSDLFYDYQSITLVAAAYVDCIESLPSGPEVQRMVDYLSCEHHAIEICQMLVVGGHHGLLKLRKFASRLSPTAWESCRHNLLAFFGSEVGATIYNRSRKSYDKHTYPVVSELPTLYPPHEEMIAILKSMDSSTYSSTSSLLDKYCSGSESSPSESKPAKVRYFWIGALMRARHTDDPGHESSVV